MEAHEVALEIELGLERLAAERTSHSLGVVDQANVLTEVRQVTVHAIADWAGARVQRVQFAMVRCNK
jgi:hypothetical protein